MKLLLPLAALFVLTACGGGSGEAGSPNSQVAVKAPLKITAMQSTTCGGSVAATKAELFVYDNNWNITGRYKAGADGSFTLATEAKLLNFSLINNLGTHIKPKISQKVYSQVEPGDYGTVFVGHNSDNCECVEASATITKLSSSPLVQMRVSNETMQFSFAKLNGNTATLNLCRQQGKNWPALAIAARNTAGSWAYARLDNYQPTQPLFINLDKEVQALPFTTNNTAATYSSYSYTQDLAYRALTANADAPVQINGLTQIKYLTHTATLRTVQSNGDGTMIDLFSTHNLLRKTADSSALNFVIPEWSKVETFAATAAKDWAKFANGFAYDYSSFAEFTALNVDVSVYFPEGNYIEQQFTGPLKGKFPASFLPADYLALTVMDTVDHSYVSIDLSQLSSANNLTAYVRQNLKLAAPLVSQREREGDFSYIGFAVQ
ncbi:hypothetical protein [Rheinheimera sp.]|uniref:hypothetical protein n=1 Tax=Rheinheimera sp. TaxID=1869214 RepID=UPI0027B8BF0C|nr:hypothetical protein [Rheinheimera sp.]